MAEDEADVRRDANPDCSVCKGAGWHWGWEGEVVRGRFRGTGNPIRLRCPCVDQNRVAERFVEWMEPGDV